MKELTQKEFEDRSAALLRAKGIFVDSGVTNNISVAFELYQTICAEREREIFLSTQFYGNRPRTFMDRYDRPLCIDCGSEMAFRVVPPNDENVKIQLVCNNEKCDTVLNSENTLDWWTQHLRIKDGPA